MTLTDRLFTIDDEGWCREVRRASCTNFDLRPDEADISLLVVHNISLPPGEFGGSYIEDLFGNQLDCDAHPYFDQLRGLRVSAHFLIRRDGSVVQFVPTVARAWHAGLSQFEGRERCNDFSIGIELEGSDFTDFCDAQYDSLALVAHALLKRHPISAIRGHEHVAPGRKTDPGPHFDWARFHAAIAGLQTSDRNSLMESQQNLSFPL
jgi:AmpD protein